MALRTLDGVDVSGKRAIVRVDFNVPMENGEIQDDTRIRAALPTLQRLLDGGASLILLSHLGRPKGKVNPDLSLRPVARRLAELLGRPVELADDVIGDDAHAKAAKRMRADRFMRVSWSAGKTAEMPSWPVIVISLDRIYFYLVI